MSFHTLEYVKESQDPQNNLPGLQSISKPHLDSFNSLFDSNLLALAVGNIIPITVFDSKDG
jgi:hypothetical protein